MIWGYKDLSYEKSLKFEEVWTNNSREKEEQKRPKWSLQT